MESKIVESCVELKFSVEGIQYYITEHNIQQVSPQITDFAKKQLVSKLNLFIQQLDQESDDAEFNYFLKSMGTWLDKIQLNHSIVYKLKEIHNIIKNETSLGKKILPSQCNIFLALRLTPFDNVKVVIVGQDPYTNESQACGLSFSVNKGTPCPTTLKNVFKQLAKNDIGIDYQEKNGDLTPWAKQGVLLLNSVLTVREKESLSHENIGWQEITDYLISLISHQKKDVVFILWGSQAQQKQQLIDKQKHHVLTGIHPSPNTKREKDFIELKHFIQTNQILYKAGIQTIDWRL